MAVRDAFQALRKVSADRFDASRHVATLAVVLLLSPIPSFCASRCNYTWSLLVFCLPTAAISYWFLRTPERDLHLIRSAFWVTLILLFSTGLLLNLLFADNFFEYPNTEAVIGWTVPSLDFFSVDREHPIPVEEFGFYLFGFLMMLLVYIWGDLYFFSEYRRKPPVAEAIVGFSWKPFTAGVLLLGAIWAHCVLRPTGHFPGYLTYLVLIPILVTTLLWRTAEPGINWRAYNFMFVLVLALSVVLEVTLGLPQGWWAYQQRWMVGISVSSWSDLPIEAVLVWFVAAIATVVTFESAKRFLHMKKPLPERFLGGRPLRRDRRSRT